MALTTFLAILALSLSVTAIMLFVAGQVSKAPHHEASAAVPADATVLQAWLAIGRRPSRRTIAAWARAADRSWVVTSLLVGQTLVLLNSALSFAHATIWPRPLPRGTRYLFGAPAPLGRLYYALDLVPVGAFVGVIAVAYVVARAMSPSEEMTLARFQRVLGASALAWVPGGVAAFLLNALAYIPQPALNVHAVQPLLFFKGMAYFAFFVYGIVLTLNPLAAASGLNR
jgi:hypothetical protein